MTTYVPSLLEKNPAKLVQAISQLAAGRSNGTGTVTLAASATTTTVTDQNCSVTSTIQLHPTTADAAATLATTFIPTATIANGSFVIHHASNTQTDRTFLYAFVG